MEKGYVINPDKQLEVNGFVPFNLIVIEKKLMSAYNITNQSIECGQADIYTALPPERINPRMIVKLYKPDQTLLAKKEIRFIKSLDNGLYVYDCIIQDRVCIVMKNMGNNLKEYIMSDEYKNKKGFCYENMYIAVSLLSSLATIHSRNIFHCDIKPENIALSWSYGQKTEKGEKKYTANFIDFGLSERVTYGSEKINSAGTPMYFSPEQANNSLERKTAQKSDIFSVGLVLWELFSGDNIHSRSNNDIMRGTFQVFTLKMQLDFNYLGPSIANYIARCLASNPVERPTAEELLLQFSTIGKNYFSI